jgi:hypothetical protein
VFGVVLELFIVEKDLFARRKDKFGAAVNALQQPIVEFHGRLPRNRDVRHKPAIVVDSLPVPVPCIRS